MNAIVLAGSPFAHAPEPKYATRRDCTYLTEGDEIARLLLIAGFHLQPWQKYVIDVAAEYRLDFLGRRIYHYATVLITVPRQSGKTTLMGPVKLHRIMTRPGIDCFSTAQTGKDAGKRMKDLINWVTGTPLAPIFKPKLSNGSEGLVVRKTGSSVVRFAPTAGAIHGETPHLVDFDEIWKYTEALGDNLLGGVSPAQITLHGQAQIWMISTMGTAKSGFMNKWVKAGRSGNDASLAYFEWSMPKGADPYDARTWWSFHPALGNTLTEEALQAEADKVAAGTMTHAEWMRAYMNILVEAEDPIIPAEDWEALAAVAPEGQPPLDSLAISYEVSPGNERSAVMATWRDAAGWPCSRVLHSAPGTIWLIPYLRRIVAEWKPAVLAADDGGPTRRITDALTSPPEDSGIDPVDVFTLGMRDFGTACDSWLAAAREDKTLKPDTTVSFARAVAHTALRTTNGIERIDRDRSTGPVCEVIASAVGLWAYDHPPTSDADQIF